MGETCYNIRKRTQLLLTQSTFRTEGFIPAEEYFRKTRLSFRDRPKQYLEIFKETP